MTACPHYCTDVTPIKNKINYIRRYGSVRIFLDKINGHDSIYRIFGLNINGDNESFCNGILPAEVSWQYILPIKLIMVLKGQHEASDNVHCTRIRAIAFRVLITASTPLPHFYSWAYWWIMKWTPPLSLD